MLSKYFTDKYDETFFKKYAAIFIEIIEDQLENYLKDEDSLIKLLAVILKKDKELCTNFLNNNLKNFNTYVKMKLWLYDIYEKFDYKYGFYFFRLSGFEKRIFSARAKKYMKDEIMELILAERTPWHFIKTDENGINHYSASWRSIWFLDKHIRFCTNVVNDENVFSEPYACSFSEEKFNFLYKYLSRKNIEELQVQERDGRILNVNGLEFLEENIYKINFMKRYYPDAKSSGEYHREDEENKIPINFLNRNQCINYLNQIQDTDKKLIRIYEKIIDLTSNHISFDVSFLFTVTKYEYSVVFWESLEFDKSKATHIFKFKVDEYDQVIKKIIDFLQNNVKVRSKLNSETFEEKKELGYLCRIDHDYFNFDNWKRKVDEILSSNSPA
jgi:hypothetical protein